MQAISLSPSASMFRDSSDEFVERSGKFEHDFLTKLKLDEHENENENENEEENENKNEEEFIEEKGEDEIEEEEEEFSFMLVNSNGSPISADDAFDNGQIRPLFPIFNQDLLFSDDYDGYDGGVHPPQMKLFIEDPNSSSSSATETLKAVPPPEGSYCDWNPKSAVKSNSTGFSKLWRFRDMKLRSNSDGKDKLVFLNHVPAANLTDKGKNISIQRVEAKKGKKTASSAHEKHYVMNRAKKESDKHKSYLPYKPDLFGFFASSHGLSRNVHPY